jgi:hypothetical protein
MIGSGIPINQSSAPFPKPIVASFVVFRKRAYWAAVPEPDAAMRVVVGIAG